MSKVHYQRLKFDCHIKSLCFWYPEHIILRWGWAGHDGHWHFGLLCKKDLQAVTVHLHLIDSCSSCQIWSGHQSNKVSLTLCLYVLFTHAWAQDLSPVDTFIYLLPVLKSMHNISYYFVTLNNSTTQKINTEQIHRNIEMWFRYVSEKTNKGFSLPKWIYSYTDLKYTGIINNTGETKYLFTIHMLAMPHYCIYTETECSLFTNSILSTHGFESSKATEGQK